MKCLIAVIGPTAVGKTKLALFLSQKFNGEIINADSRQVYSFMDIGTAKPSTTDRKLIPHHLIDVVNPDEPFSLALYKDLAIKAIEDIQIRGKFPFLVGGTGLYIWSIIEGWMIPEVPPNIEFRKQLENIAAKEGTGDLFQKLKSVDPVAAAKIMPSNLRRIIRALEIHQSTGTPPSQLWQKKLPPFSTLIIGLTTHRQTLYNMIDSRVDEMINNGLVDEIRSLIAMGYSLDLPSMSGIGYRQIGKFLQNETSLSEATQQIKNETHKFARRQYTWFHLDDNRIHWFDICGNILAPINNLVENFLKRN